jgi:hypothetical protein
MRGPVVFVARTHTVKMFMHCYRMFLVKIINRKLQFSCSQNLNSCDFYLWGILKDKRCSSNPCTEDDMNVSIQDVVF